MHWSQIRWVPGLVALLCAGSLAHAQVPSILNQQGVITDPAGVAASGLFTLTFSLYDQEADGQLLWQEVHDPVQVQGGVFNVILGMQEPLEPALFAANPSIWSEIQVDTEAPMPRTRAAAVIYALLASSAASADTLGPACSGCVGPAHLSAEGCEEGHVLKLGGGGWACAPDDNEDTVYTAGDGLALDGSEFSVPAGAIDGTHIADASVGLADLADVGCSDGQLLKWNGAGWACAKDENDDTLYTAGTGLDLTDTEFALNEEHVTGLAKAAAYDEVGELEAALPGWDQNAADDLTVGTELSGDVSGTYAATNIVDGAVQPAHLAACGASEILKYGEDGWGCDEDVDTNTTYTAGSGLTLDETAFLVAASGITSDHIADGAVGTTEIADGSVALADIGVNGCADGHVIKRTGEGWGCAPDDNDNTTYTAGNGLELSDTEFALNDAHVTGLAKAAAYDEVSELEAALAGWDQNAGDDLTVQTQLSGDVSGTYDSTSINDGAVEPAHLAGCGDSEILKYTDAGWGCHEDVDTNTTYAAGSGLTLQETTFLVTDGGIGSGHIADGAVTTDDIANGTIEVEDLSDGVLTATQNTFPVNHNRGFEDTPDLLGWTISGAGDEGTPKIQTVEKHSGVNGLQLTVNSNNKAAQLDASYEYPVSMDDVVRLRLLVKSLDITKGSATYGFRASLTFRAPDGSVVSTAHVDINETPGDAWTPYLATAKAPAGATKVAVALTIHTAATGTVYVDDVTLSVSALDLPAQMAAVYRQVPIGTVIDWWRPNDSFPVPLGFQICDGSAVLDSRSPLKGATLPNLNGQFVRGATDPDAIGDTGGSNNHAHNHDHASKDSTADGAHGHTHDHASQGSTTQGGHAHSHDHANLNTSTTGDHAHSHDHASQGSSSAGGHAHTHDHASQNTSTTGNHAHSHDHASQNSSSAGGHSHTHDHGPQPSSSTGNHSHTHSHSTSDVSNDSHTHKWSYWQASNRAYYSGDGENMLIYGASHNGLGLEGSGEYFMGTASSVIGSNDSWYTDSDSHDHSTTTETSSSTGSHSHSTNLPNTSSSTASSHTHSTDLPNVTSSSTGDHAHSLNLPSQTSSDAAAHAHTTDLPSVSSSTTGNHAHSVDLPNQTSSSAGGHSHSVDLPSQQSSGAAAHAHSVDLPSVSSSQEQNVPVHTRLLKIMRIF